MPCPNVTRHTAQRCCFGCWRQVTVGSAWRPTSWVKGAGLARCRFRPRPDPGSGLGEAAVSASASARARRRRRRRRRHPRPRRPPSASPPATRRHCSCSHPSPARRGRLRAAPQRRRQGSSHLPLESREPSLAVSQRGRPRLRRWSLFRGRAAPRGRRSAHRAVWSLRGSESAGLGRG